MVTLNGMSGMYINRRLLSLLYFIKVHSLNAWLDTSLLLMANLPVDHCMQNCTHAPYWNGNDIK